MKSTTQPDLGFGQPMRRSDGSIDTDHYVGLAKVARAAAVRSLLRSFYRRPVPEISRRAAFLMLSR